MYAEGYSVNQVNILLVMCVASVVLFTGITTVAAIMFDDRHESSNKSKEGAVENAHKITKTEKKVVI